jgi:hypothetical protein
MPVERSQIIQFVKSSYLFKKADDSALDFLVSSLQSADFYQGEIVYNQDDLAANLYFILRGKVKITQFKKGEEESMGILEEGDIFGYEMLDYDSKCQTRATAESQVTVLWLDREHARQVLEKISTLNLDLKLLYESYLLSLNTRFSWCNEGEVIYFLARRHVFFLIRRFVPIIIFTIITFPIIAILSRRFSGYSTPTILLVADILIILLWSVWSYLDWSNDYAVISNQRVAFVEKVILLYDSREEAPLNAVLSVTTDTDYWGRILGYGDVIARTYAGVIKLSHIAYPKQVAFLLTSEWDRVKSLRIQTEQSELEEAIRKRLGFKMEAKNPDGAKAGAADQNGKGSLRDRLLKPFRLRIVKGDVVTWRTHWLLLVKKLALPSFIFLGMIALVVVRLLGILSILSILAVIGLAIVCMIISALWWLYNFLDWSNDIYIVTQDQVIDIDQKPLGKVDRKAASLKNVQSIEFERLGLIGLLFNYGTVYINVGETTLTFDEVFNPAEVQRELFKHLAARDYREKHAQIEADQKRVADWIAAYHKVSEEERKLQNPFSPDTNLR